MVMTCFASAASSQGSVSLGSGFGSFPMCFNAQKIG